MFLYYFDNPNMIRDEYYGNGRDMFPIRKQVQAIGFTEEGARSYYGGQRVASVFSDYDDSYTLIMDARGPLQDEWILIKKEPI